MALVERGGWCVHSMLPLPIRQPSAKSCARTLNAKPTSIPTKANSIVKAVHGCSRHKTVKHTAGEYVRGDVTTNTVESYFSVFKRGMRGIYQHCSEKHLHRYLAEFDFRYNNRVRLAWMMPSAPNWPRASLASA